MTADVWVCGWVCRRLCGSGGRCESCRMGRCGGVEVSVWVCVYVGQLLYVSECGRVSVCVGKVGGVECVG